MKKRIKFFLKYNHYFLLSLGFFLVTFSFLANFFGLDINNGWGPKRVIILSLGLILLLTGLFSYFSLFPKIYKKIFKSKKFPIHYWFIPIVYFIIAIAFLSPLASDKLVPGEYDFGTHINFIQQAQKAISEGQFPIRIAPYMNWGYRYALFQFYSPFPYTIAGLIVKFITPDNAFLAYRLMVLGALFISAIYIFRISYCLTKNIRPSFLAGIVYMTSPYFIINIHARSAWTEVIAQGLLPLVFFYTIKIFFTKKQKYIIAAVLGWCMLCTTHLITFIYSILFVVLFILVISFPYKKDLLKIFLTLIPVPIAALLSWYYLQPSIFYPLMLKNTSISSPFGSIWLTPIFTLLSPVSIPPEPQPGVLSANTPGLHTAIGWIILLAVGYILFTIIKHNENWRISNNKKIIISLLVMFFISFFIVWSPVDFWKFIPSVFYVAQFTYRFMTYTMLSGAILTAFAIVYLFDHKEIKDIWVLIGILLIVMSHASWLNIQNMAPIQVKSAMDTFAFQDNYQYQPSTDAEIKTPDYNVDYSQPFCNQVKQVMECQFNLRKGGLVQIPHYYYPGLLNVQLNNNDSDYFLSYDKKTKQPLMAMNLSQGKNLVTIKFTGSSVANLISLITWIGLFLWIFLFFSMNQSRLSFPNHKKLEENLK